MATYEVQLASYILGKFYLGTDVKYKCGNAKLQKLVVIAQLRKMYAMNQVLFDANIMINPCGFGVRSIAAFFPIDIYGEVETAPNDSDRKIDPNSIHDAPELGEAYDGGMRFVMKEDDKWLRDTFCRFGSYGAKELGDMMNRMTLHTSEDISLSSKDLLENIRQRIDPDADAGNEIVTYVREGI